ncbi:hypothetical protein ULMS_18670 [Patiriisocius marinistellae]|uniref:MORN repeat variant n=1 Tax=Patiriisocius marinistellae TaxID=2494560 RepID=A0A5J4G178_9FLAO|nr:hypothetical protein [Patiriisocius marinistellae]GEQ86359.1 hypothetical protein ULMS_18670 [Patiriisocius marinistellae]
MKNSIKIIALLLVINASCKAQLEAKKHLNSMENFNIERFEKHKVNGSAVYEEMDHTYHQFGDAASGYVEHITLPKPEVSQIYAEYYPDGSLKIKGLMYPNEFKKGIWKEYDIKGNTITESDYDMPFTFTFENITDWIKVENIDTSTNKFGIFRSVDEEIPIWEVNWLGKNGNTIEFAIINGINGEIVEKGNRNYKNN